MLAWSGLVHTRNWGLRGPVFLTVMTGKEIKFSVEVKCISITK